MAVFARRRIRPARRGGYDVALPDQERDVLARLPMELVELLDATAGDEAAVQADPALARLFPPAYREEADAERAAEFRRLMSEDLLDRHRDALRTMAAGAHATHLEADELHAWMSALTQLRLVLGTRIGVTEDLDYDDVGEDDPAAPAFALYGYLSWLQEEVVAALSSGQ